MFQTEIILFLQSFESIYINFFFKIINCFGYSNFYIPILMIIMFGIDFRKGFYLLHVLLWTSFVTTFLKEYFALPRPSDVDLNVKLINKDYSNPTRFNGMGASHFFGGLPQEVILYFRNLQDYSHGLPSGHVSSTTAIWGSVSQLFQQLWIKILAISLIVLMPITRMYLGRHFLIDVLGGLIVGLVFVMIFYHFVYKSQAIHNVFSERVKYFSLNPKTIPILSYFFITPLVFYWIAPQDNLSDAGNLLGLNIGFMLLSIKGLPLDAGTFLQKILRIFIAIVLFFGSNLILKSIGMDDIPTLEFIRAIIVSFIVIYVTVMLGIKFRIYKRKTLNEPE